MMLTISKTQLYAQVGNFQWGKDGYHYYDVKKGNLVYEDVRDPKNAQIFLNRSKLVIKKGDTIGIENFRVADAGDNVLINTNTRKVWRQYTRGDYWLYNVKNGAMKQLGKGKPSSSLMFAKLSPDGSKVAYVSEHNIYVEDLRTGFIKPLTTSGTKKLINGTFDWAYEEEFDCRDGFRWSPDGTSIAYWQINATTIPNYLMLNTTDSVYSHTVPVEYPVAGVNPSACRIGVVNVATGKNKWMNVPGDAIQNYIPRMEWAGNSNELILQQLNRAQNQSRIIICNVSNATARVIFRDEDKSWVEVSNKVMGWDWIDNGKSFVWLSEKDGWQHAYRINREGQAKLLTPGDYDVMQIVSVDNKNQLLYFIASPENATQRFLYKTSLSGGKAERVSPVSQNGYHRYEISPDNAVAVHSFTNITTMPVKEYVSLQDHNHISGDEIIPGKSPVKSNAEFFKVTTVDGVTLDGWVVKPKDFDPAKKYPVVFYVYGEPASQTVSDIYYNPLNRLYQGSMAADGYLYVSLDNRGTPAPKGREWRKAIYKNIGVVNIRDQAMGAKEVLKWPYADTSRVAVWGWSGGGSSTLNLMFQYPEIYKTGIAIAAVANQLTYDDIYQERYMGVPTDEQSRSFYIKGSPISHVKGLRGNLLYIHGTGDDNVHYNNAEQLINELVKNNKQFQLMSYPNRTHSISEGAGTTAHLRILYTNYLKEHCPPGAR
ncbi:DPP IV N-terminal domain-containing protein [Mucilaginibacter ginkgonis]|uniref:DPP IV N-terminal domain-containing protein n=2 Tax=Mucilaginibacter ginkgonis TaxID=2682091 RepID=A0A7T7JIQ8_9SPHI|nr:DPP IV N-terminal domain-containing protein [Mucilaginibacter ginkgonis]